MPRKDGSTLKGRPGASSAPLAGSTQVWADTSWAAVGVDTSMTSIAAVAVGYDGKLKKRVGPFYGEIRWQPDEDYYKRLGDAAGAFGMVQDLLGKLWVLSAERVYIGLEEPFYYGAMSTGQSGWLKQQAEVSGAFKGGLARYGYLNIHEINNSQWHAVVRKDGIEFNKIPRGTPRSEKDRITLANKFLVKTWAMAAYSLPDLPDLVKSKTGAKIIRPESGFGAKAKAVQPSDVYDAAGVCAWMADYVEENVV